MGGLIDGLMNAYEPVAETLAPSLGGTEKLFRGTGFLNAVFFQEKISIFTPKISDENFRIFTALNVIKDPFFTRKTTISEKNSLITPFLLCSYFRAHQTTLYFSKYWGGRMHGPSPTSNFLGDRSPQPP